MENHRASILPFKASTSSAYNAEAEKESNVIGQRIDKARKDAGLSMSELSDGIFNSVSFLNKIYEKIKTGIKVMAE